MPVEHPLVRKDSLVLRKYQEAVISRAVEENTLVVLPTGLGKTVIAAMVAAHRLRRNPNSKVVFLAPTKPLVVQHKRSFAKFLTTEDTCVLTGSEPPESRRTLWNSSSIIFATPQTIENDIIRGVDLADVSLIIFDEAHRAVGDYSYVQIAKEYMKKGKDPMTLGLTASPSSQKEKVDEICKNLSIKYIEAKTEKDEDVKEYVQNVDINWVRVNLPPQFKKLQDSLQEVLKKELSELKNQDCIASADLMAATKTVLLDAQHNIRKRITSGDISAYSAASTVAAAIKVGHAIELAETQSIHALDEYFTRLRLQKSKAVRKLMANPNMTSAIDATKKMRNDGVEHPKMAEVTKIVGKHRGGKVLVFTQYRDSVDKITQKLKEAGITAHEFIGQMRKGINEGMTQKKQIKVLDDFADGKYEALVATSVAEEGLDIPEVDAVIFYEPVPSEIRTIQRRGRTGRQAAGKVYVLMARGTRDEGYYWSAYHKQKKMENIVSQMKKDGKDSFTAEDDKTNQQSILSYDSEPSDKIKVFIDNRERNSTILSILRDNCEIELTQLPVGDYLLSDRVCVERKTVEDFLQSIIDKRLMKQMIEMDRNFKVPILIIEGIESLYGVRNIHPNAIRGVLSSISCDFNVRIIPTEDESDTAQMLISIAKREQLEKNHLVGLRGEKKPELLSERQRFVVESLPNVSAVLADRMLKKFKNVENIMLATEKKLMEIDGIGDKKAEEIRKVIKNDYKRI